MGAMIVGLVFSILAGVFAMVSGFGWIAVVASYAGGGAIGVTAFVAIVMAWSVQRDRMCDHDACDYVDGNGRVALAGGTLAMDEHDL